MSNIAINGFGRIGRLALRAALTKYPNITISAVNTSGSMDIHGWALLFKYDTAYGKFSKEIIVHESAQEGEIGSIEVDGKKIPFLAFRNPEEIPWGRYTTETVLESTGVFRTRADAEKHLAGGAKRIVISAPPKGGTIKTVMCSINDSDAHGETVISNGSCTTYSAAPVIKTVLSHFGIEKMTLTTIHAYTSDQRLLDNSHKDLRRARSAAQNIIPTSSGSAEAIVAIMPELAGKFESSAMRVPVMTGSLSDHTFLLPRSVTVEEVNDAFKQESEGQFKSIMTVTEDPIVSSDIIGNDASAIVDLSLTSVIDGNLLKVYSWYDNEWSYACRLIELAARIDS
ncbi:MAG: Glyceraldehyde-3-phosphate dehydrogenase [Microgenomates group bacterium GW2011_GWC1_41_8]|uniref:Glyceraldehyde-3-phosphate dehydrogenase n=3 Tax=Candidatus Roizmaniibacteriota TaxID=1752723 RepID=A0A0G0X9E7_9BACT|nr:MAG: Glyceraldehyde-3-phosphate dehydrogenase [Candidatus Roizmanbacteria bacterium GW2011_GWB1_40_7]KKS21599.1 MAG: Glyceraldehyde-3-phosphate dehydrogenase [Candidatus Roizmanbacteria bacterium GW2011_GWC2_41_7]KKS21782.1 MAG: Glyceraldehyde-3-phosphate dehydrogenase [Microgenomates group bacterium GW2011_GWC1_41_8]